MHQTVPRGRGLASDSAKSRLQWSRTRGCLRIPGHPQERRTLQRSQSVPHPQPVAQKSRDSDPCRLGKGSDRKSSCMRRVVLPRGRVEGGASSTRGDPGGRRFWVFATFSTFWHWRWGRILKHFNSSCQRTPERGKKTLGFNIFFL